MQTIQLNLDSRELLKRLNLEKFSKVTALYVITAIFAVASSGPLAAYPLFGLIPVTYVWGVFTFCFNGDKSSIRQENKEITPEEFVDYVEKLA